MIMRQFEIGDGVRTKGGPLKGIYGVVVWYYGEKDQYLVRFTGAQQMYYADEELEPWT